LRSSHQSHLVAVLRCAKWWLVAYEWVRFPAWFMSILLPLQVSTSLMDAKVLPHAGRPNCHAKKYLISPSLRILGSEGLFVESGMHEHSFALNLVHKTSE
jgi:hypothetical protein